MLYCNRVKHATLNYGLDWSCANHLAVVVPVKKAGAETATFSTFSPYLFRTLNVRLQEFLPFRLEISRLAVERAVLGGLRSSNLG